MVGTVLDGDGEGGALPGGTSADLPLFTAARFNFFKEVPPDLVVTPAG